MPTNIVLRSGSPVYSLTMVANTQHATVQVVPTHANQIMNWIALYAISSTAGGVVYVTIRTDLNSIPTLAIPGDGVAFSGFAIPVNQYPFIVQAPANKIYLSAITAATGVTLFAKGVIDD